MPEEIPLWWKNESPFLYHLHIMHSQLPFIDFEKHEQALKANAIDRTLFSIEHFPVIKDFEVILWTNISHLYKEGDQLTYKIYFFSSSCDFLAKMRFGDFTPQELSQDDFTIPAGDFQMPYCDFDQGWAILIAEQDAFVSILMGSFEAGSKGQSFSTWFKVDRERYYQQWEKAVALSRDFARI